MEPGVVRLYSSSPPPLDEGGEEEEDDDFGDFGIYCCGVSSSFSFSELETSSTSGQSNESETSERHETPAGRSMAKDHSVLKSKETQVDDSKAFHETYACGEQITHGAFEASPGLTGDIKESKDSTPGPVVRISDEVSDHHIENPASICDEPSFDVPERLTVAPGTTMEEHLKEIKSIPTIARVNQDEAGEVFKEVNPNSVDSTGRQEESNPAEINPSLSMDEDFKEAADASTVEPDDVDSHRTPDNFVDVSDSTRDGFTDLVTALTCCSTDDDFTESDFLKDLIDNDEDAELRHDLDELFSELPPSESFADFSSAPFGGLAGLDQESWSAFDQQEELGSQKETWTAFSEEKQSASATEDSHEDLVLEDWNIRLQRFLHNVFPLEVTLEDREVLTLRTLLELSGHDKLRFGESVTLWRHLLDIHGAHGLKVQWVGSRGNRILLDCLGIHNILFTGHNKKPVIVPAFAAGLGMLEPTKDPVKPFPVFSSSSPSRGRSTLCTQQVASPLDFYQDGRSQRRSSFSLMPVRSVRHTRQKSYS